jgi:hypothetical protein
MDFKALELEKHELKWRMEDLRRRMPGPNTELRVGAMWMLDMARVQYDISIFMLKLSDGLQG